MPVFAEPALQGICQSLESFSPLVMAGAIEQARDPDRARQLEDRLLEAWLRDRDDNEPPSFLPVGLCVVLGEAKSELSIPALLKIVAGESARDTLLLEVTVYALQRMGPPVFEQAMTLAATSADPETRKSCYDILGAAEDADPAMRQRAADFCYQRVLEEPDSAEEPYWSPAQWACDVLVRFHDGRARQVIEKKVAGAQGESLAAWRQRSEDLSESKLRESHDWRKDWPDRCERWAAIVDETKDLWEEHRVHLTRDAAVDALASEFAASPFAQGLNGFTPQLAGQEIASLLKSAQGDFPGSANQLELRDIRQVLFAFIPRQALIPPDLLDQWPRLLMALFKFLHATGRLAKPQPFFNLAREAETRLKPAAMDRANWGMMKQIYMSGLDHGYNIYDPEQLKAYMADLGRRVSEKQAASGPADHSTPSNTPLQGPTWSASKPAAAAGPTAPIRRTEPKVARNAPCPCGSGRKYKKCCGRA